MVLRAVPRPGADPLMEAAAGQLKEGCDPYRLVLPAERETLAEYYADELRARCSADAAGPAERFLVAAPEAPLQLQGVRREGVLRRAVACRFRWFWTGASSREVEGGRPEFPGRRAERGRVALAGGLRGVSAAAARGDDAGDASRAQADQDPAAVVFGLGYGPVHESLPFAAAVLAAVRRRGPGARSPAAAGPGRRDPADIAERIRHLGELHQAGLVTDEEFSAKKAELLAEL